jgi:primosomal protein N' (replication factor Y)
MPIAKIALDIPLPRLFDYRSDTLGTEHVGARVVVPFGGSASGKQGRLVVGVVVDMTGHSEVSPDRLREIDRVLDDSPQLPASWLAMVKFCAGYYQKPIGEVLMSALPPRLRTARPIPPLARQYRFAGDGESLLGKTPARSQRRRALIERLLLSPISQAEFDALEGSERKWLRTMIASGTVVAGEPPRGKANFVAMHALAGEQAAVVEDIASRTQEFGVHVLFGITGSGKTEVYLHLIAKALAGNRQALVLVPEIALTPALESAFATRFPGAHIVMQHSAMTELDRVAGWLDAQDGRADIIIGTRLAAWVPLARPGIIVVDEEQDASYKQQDGLRYSARDLAIYRARDAGIPVILSSATPSLETFQHALSGRYRLHRLTARAHAAARLPEVILVDTRRHPAQHGLCEPLAQAIDKTLEKGEQVLVFLNRRGYAPVLACSACGWVSDCPDCSAHLVVHLGERRLRCHHCGHVEPLPKACPDCGNLDLQPLGRGTQRLETTLAERFPAARILRVDGDSTRNRGSLEAMLDDVHSGKVNLLIGTQILAKGHHFSKLTLVAVLNADAGLFAADYRAGERLFAQLEQVAGRAGRADLPGEVWIQTRFPEHPLYQALQRHDFEGFAASVLQERESAGFPPFVFEAALRAEAQNQERAQAFLQLAMEVAPTATDGITVFRPVPMAIPRMAKLERVQVVIQSESRPRLQAWLQQWSQSLYALRGPAVQGIRWHLDIDPTEF